MHMRQRSWATAEAARDVETKDVKWFGQSQGVPRTGWWAVVRHQGKTFFLLLAAWVVLVYYIRRAPVAEQEFAAIAPKLAAATLGNTTVPPANLHVLVPASRGDANLCKVLVSSGILGYPSPVIINWNQSYHDNFVDGGSHLAKITGIYDHLSKLEPQQDDDLILMVDGYDIWFQLRPQTLIDRYFAVNRRADKRIKEQLKEAATEHNTHQEIIFGCQKRCWPWSENDPPCYAVPESDLSTDVYGPRTDTLGEEDNPYINFRPRFLNSGVAIGTVRAMRKLFGQALKLMETEKNFGSDQFIFSHIYGDQEVWREALRQDSLSRPEKMAEKVVDTQPKVNWKPDHIEEVRAKAANTSDGTYEFGIGVDFRSEIGINTVFAEDDTAWLTWSNSTQKREAESALGIDTQQQPRLRNLSSDITNTVPPFWTFNHEPSLPRWTNWSSVQLFTNVYHGNVPAVIHHNAHRDGRKALRTQWWDKIWFFEHMRTLYDASIYEPIVPIAYSGYDAESQRVWWPGERWKGGGRNGPKIDSEIFDEQWVGFEEMCHEFHEEVFRDGKGPWILPEAH